MFLSRIVLKNFKSFYKTSVIDLPDKITAIVGPNGSGKSNIVDAVRWALGEQSFKNIRIEKGSNLIFTSRDASAGFAEVELVFDNSSKIFPVDYTEVSIRRRIDKDGNNFYYLNRQPCRLKDISELILSAKLGVRGFSIINQGSVEDILRVSPYERRLMLEENLGLKGLEIKKESSLRKLENTLINLDKIKAQIQEITPHLRFLKRQVKHWEERKENEQKLRTSRLRYFSYLYYNLISKEGREKDNSSVLQDKLKALEKEIAALKERLGLGQREYSEELEKQIAALTQEIITLQKRKFHLLQRVNERDKEKENKIDYTEIIQKLEDIKNKLQGLLLENNLEKIKQALRAIIEQVSSLTKKQDSIKPSVNNPRSEELEVIENEIEEKERMLDKLQKEREEKTKSFRQKFVILEEKREEKERILNKIHQEEIQNEKYNLRLQDLERRFRAAGIDEKTIKQYLQENPEVKELSQEEFIRLERKIARLDKEIREAGMTDENILREYHDVQQRYEFLNQQMEDLTKSMEDLKNLIKKLTSEIEESFRNSLQEINRYFNRYFRLMFKGGSARLVITKEKKSTDDGLENNSIVDKKTNWGLEIKVDIPKTKLKSLQALSGGEKTLTAISLLFAIINQSNPPLVIVDEIDAALDEENSRRFAEILKELSQDTQFILVTHNRLVMEAASVIYGVTLKNNASQIISIKLDDEERILTTSDT